jgi:hypothetical protein
VLHSSTSIHTSGPSWRSGRCFNCAGFIGVKNCAPISLCTRYDVYMIERASIKKFSSQEEECAFLCTHIRRREEEYLKMNKESDEDDALTIQKEIIREYGEYDPKVILKRGYVISEHDLRQTVERLHTSHDRENDLRECINTYGVRNTLSILEEFRKVHTDRRTNERLFRIAVSGVSCG